VADSKTANLKKSLISKDAFGVSNVILPSKGARDANIPGNVIFHADSTVRGDRDDFRHKEKL
jgi:hypothetical protein